MFNTQECRSRGSSVSTVAIYRLDDWGLIPGKRKRTFPLTSVSRPATRPTQPLGIEGPFASGKVRLGYDTDPILCRGQVWVGAILLSPLTPAWCSTTALLYFTQEYRMQLKVVQGTVELYKTIHSNCSKYPPWSSCLHTYMFMRDVWYPGVNKHSNQMSWLTLLLRIREVAVSISAWRPAILI
jgi:hypothetical protein